MPENYLKSLFESEMWRHKAKASLKTASRKAVCAADSEIGILSTGIFLDYLNLVNRLNIEYTNCWYNQNCWETLGFHSWLRISIIFILISAFRNALSVKFKWNIKSEINYLLLCTQLALQSVHDLTKHRYCQKRIGWTRYLY